MGNKGNHIKQLLCDNKFLVSANMALAWYSQEGLTLQEI